jgi:hypothetical protein
MKNFIFLVSVLFFGTNGFAFTLGSKQITGGWDTKLLTFNVNESSCTALGITAASLNAAIDSSVAIWNKVTTSSLKLARGTVVTTTAASNPPVIFCSTALDAGILATGSIGQLKSGRPSTGAIEINGDSAKLGYFPNSSATESAATVAHEMGHVLGLGHSEKIYTLMYYSSGDRAELNLAQDDADGLTWLNPRSEPGDGLFGCGTIQEINNKQNPNSGEAIFNWVLMLLVAFLGAKLPRFLKWSGRKSVAY